MMQRGERTGRRRLAGAGLAGVLLLSGCTSADELAPAQELTVVSAARHPLAAAGAAEAAPNWRPRRRPPSWIQWIFSNWPDSGCTTIAAGATGLYIEAERLEELRLCVDGYAGNASPRLSIESPDGDRIEPAAHYNGATWDWAVQPGAEGDGMTELGTYQFQITGTPPLTSGRIVVKRSTEPRAAITDDTRPGQPALRPGQSVRVRMAGYRPGQTVGAAVYRRRGKQTPSGERLRYLAKLPDTVVDGSGEGMLRWVVPASTVPGRYGIWIEPGPPQAKDCDRGTCKSFEVGG
ncbi:hypothetical protein AB0F81_35735 [Actinoplanes sp. NPDC024001]|uniref:hypothetical protein n=1 Tax=Actinoplanes sp. NPDC024001 TaxID=3154598 RepID=UPI0033FCC1A8